jgi:hypothetical protein
LAVATATGLTIVKTIPYRGDAGEEYSNTYWFKPVAPPADAAAWKALFDAVVLQEKTLYPNTVHVVRGYGYNDDTGHKPGDTGAVAGAVWTEDLTVAPLAPVAGTLDISAGFALPGDDAVWVRWKTERVTSPGGKAIYVRKYFHPAVVSQFGPVDTVLAGQRTALLAFGTKLMDGSLLGGRTITTAGRLDTISAREASVFTTTRTLKRRGKRP